MELQHCTHPHPLNICQEKGVGCLGCKKIIWGPSVVAPSVNFTSINHVLNCLKRFSTPFTLYTFYPPSLAPLLVHNSFGAMLVGGLKLHSSRWRLLLQFRPRMFYTNSHPQIWTSWAPSCLVQEIIFRLVSASLVKFVIPRSFVVCFAVLVFMSNLLRIYHKRLSLHVIGISWASPILCWRRWWFGWIILRCVWGRKKPGYAVYHCADCNIVAHVCCVQSRRYKFLKTLPSIPWFLFF